MTIEITLLDKWLLLGRIVSDSSLPPSAAAVAYVLLNHHNGETGRCDPSRETIAKQIAITGRSVTSALTALEAGGYFQRRLRGHHQTSIYVPLIDGNITGAKNSSSLESNFQCEGGKKLPGWKISAFQTGSQLPPNPSIEPYKKGDPGASPSLLILTGGKPSGSANSSKRDPRLYLAKHGCTIDSYWPDSERMGAWAAEKAPLVENPVARETVEGIKDVWRRRGERPKDFDATYRTYLRQRQKWALEKSEAAAAAHDPKRRAGMC